MLLRYILSASPLSTYTFSIADSRSAGFVRFILGEAVCLSDSTVFDPTPGIFSISEQKTDL